MKNNYFKSDKMVETRTTNVYWGQKLLCTFRHTGKRNLNSSVFSCLVNSMICTLQENLLVAFQGKKLLWEYINCWTSKCYVIPH